MGLPFSGLTRLVCCLAVFVALLVSLVLLMKDDKVLRTSRAALPPPTPRR